MSSGSKDNKEQEDVELAPIGSLSPECTPLKIKYDNCFNQWFAEKFLKGDNDLSVCDDLFKAYNDCLKAAMIRMNINLTELDREMIDSKKDNFKSGTSGEKSPDPKKK